MSNIMGKADAAIFGLSAQERVSGFYADTSGDPLSNAFSSKFTVHAGARNKSVSKEQLPDTFQNLYGLPGSKPAVIYVHIPFCQSKCLFCGFAGSKADDEAARVYIDGLIKEIDFLSSLSYPQKAPVRAVYFGGGTPSALPPAELYRLINKISGTFNLVNDCEITLEGRLHDFEPSRADTFFDAGFNRFSIGVQSFDTAIRKSLGRFSDREKVISILSSLVDKQKAAVIIDLIYGLPGQSIEALISDLDLADSIGVDGLDTYQLNIFKNTPLFNALEAGKVPPAAKLEEHGYYYKSAMEHMLYKKWSQISLSHFARGRRERNVYNPWAKRKNNCIGIGAGAGGNINGWGYYKAPVVPKYLGMADRGFFFPDVLTEPSDNAELISEIIGDIEQGFMDMRKFPVVNESLNSVLKNWEKAGLISFDRDYANLTVAGKFWGVNLTQAVIELTNIVCGEKDE